VDKINRQSADKEHGKLINKNADNEFGKQGQHRQHSDAPGKSPRTDLKLEESDKPESTTAFKRFSTSHRLRINDESVSDLLRFKGKVRYRYAQKGQWHSGTAKVVKDDGASENHVSRSLRQCLHNQGACLEVEDAGWMLVETANANTQHSVEKRHRVAYPLDRSTMGTKVAQITSRDNSGNNTTKQK
jgi:hypothetical protein